MHHPILDLSRPALVPELRAEVAAGAAADIQRPLIAVAAVRTFPDQLAVLLGDLYFTVIAAGLTVIRFGVQLCIQDCFIYMPHQRKHRRDVVLQIRYFHIGNRSAGRKRLKLRFKCQLDCQPKIVQKLFSRV